MLFPRMAYHNRLDIEAIADRARLVGRTVARTLIIQDQGQNVPFSPAELFSAVDYSVDGMAEDMRLCSDGRVFALHFALREALREAERLYREMPGEYGPPEELPPAEAVENPPPTEAQA